MQRFGIKPGALYFFCIKHIHIMETSYVTQETFDKI